MHAKNMGPLWLSATLLAGALAGALATFQAHAAIEEDDSSLELRLGAFGSIGAAYHRAEGIELRRSIDQPHGATASRVEMGVDSLIGAQANLRLAPAIDLVVQGVSRQYSNNSWYPQLTWGFARFSPDESIAVRFGRVGVDTQLEADSRYIGYSYLPIRPSQELLATVPIDHLDGGDFTWRTPLADGLLKVKGFLGRTLAKASTAGQDLSLGQTNTYGLILGYHRADLEIRVLGGQSRIKENGDPQALIDVLRGIPLPQATATANALDNQNTIVHFHGADIAYNKGPLKLQASYLRQSATPGKVALPNTRALSLLAGYRYASLTPYLSYGRVRSSAVKFNSGLAAFVPAQLEAAINATVDGAQLNQSTTGIGLRYDLAEHFALKAQVDRIKATQSLLVLAPTLPAAAEKRLTLFSITLDFAF